MTNRNDVVDGKLTYQHHKLAGALKLVPKQRRRVCVDIGGHVGLWSVHLAKAFQHVHAFEPVDLHRRLFRANVPMENVTLHACALGDMAGQVIMKTGPASSGDTHVASVLSPMDVGDADMRTLDSFCLNEVDFIKIDTEGFELPIVQGARDTILRNRPIMVVEQKDKEAEHRGRPPKEALKYLLAIGMVELRKPMSGDYFLGWP